MSYTEHDETMDSRSLDGITASGAAESSPVGVSQEAPGVERADPAGDRTEGIAPVLEAGTEEEATAPAAQAEGGGLDPPEAPLPSGARPLGRPPRRLRRKIPPAAPRMI